MEETNLNWHDFHERTKFRLVYHLCIFFIVLMSVVALVNLSNEHFSATPNVAVIVMCLIGLAILKIKGNYRIVAMFSSVASLVIISLAFFLLPATHYLTPMWMVVNILFTFFILGKIWGISILVVHFLVLFNYLWFKHTGNILAVKNFTPNDIITFITEYSIVGFAIAYILNLYIVNSKYSRQALESSNQKLQDQNAIITKQNKEMEVMLREIHHRVKNNLQIITSLLRLQANSMDRQADEFYKEAINRVTAMAIIHERMYQSGSLSNFDMDQYVRTLVSSILSNYTLEKIPKVEIQVELEEIGSNGIVPLALLINELMLNSLKHAFDDQLYPVIKIHLHQKEAFNFQMEYYDNGMWKDSNEPSFGSEIIEAMVAQLDGTFQLVKSENGSHYYFDLKNLM